MRFGKSTIRERFNEDFDKLGIECFTLYVQDRWQPAFYMPHEVDPYLYYPETMYSGPLREYFRPLLDGLNSSETSGTVYSNRVKKQVRLRYLCLNDAIASPLNTPCLLADYYDKPCFQNFVQREQIQSVIIFSPEVPIHAHAAQDAPELLFLNSRNARWRITSTPLSDNLSALHDLAKDILTFAHETFLRRTTSPRWNRALLRSVQNQSRLTDLMHSEFSRATPGSSTAHKHLCTRLLRVLWENYENRDSSLLATLHLLKSSEAKLSLVDEAYYPQSARPPKEQVFAPSRPDGISITLCTSLVGRPHLLSYVDPPTTPSVFLTGGEAQFLNHNRAKFPFELMRQIGFDLYHRKKLGNRVIRAFLVNESPSWDDIQAKMPLESRRNRKPTALHTSYK